MNRLEPLILGLWAAGMLWVFCTERAVAGPDQSFDPPVSLPDFWHQKCLCGNWKGQRDQLEKLGVVFSLQNTLEIFGNPKGGNFGNGEATDGLLNTGVNIDLETLSGGDWPNATFHANTFWIYGENLSQKYVGDYSGLSNINAYNTFRLDELWLQQGLFGTNSYFKVGMAGVDSDFVLSNSSGLFINSTFGAFPFVSFNFQKYNPPIYPLDSPTLLLHLVPTSSIYLQAAIYNGDVGSQQSNNHGTRFDFSPQKGALTYYELGYLLNQDKGSRGLPGTYKFGAWLHTANFTSYSSQAAVATGTGPLKSTGAYYGIYGVADQTIWREVPSEADSRSLNLFLRMGTAPSNTSQDDFDFDCGLNLTAPFPGRKDDIAGIGFARSAISHDFSEASVAEGGPAFRAEALIEGTYLLKLTPWCTLQPDVQYIFRAGATTTSPDALVVGLRTVLAF